MQPKSRKVSQCEEALQPIEEAVTPTTELAQNHQQHEHFPSFQTEVSRVLSPMRSISSENFGIRKRVNFKLNNDDEHECIEEEVQVEQAVAMRKVYRKTRKKRTNCNELRKYNSLDRDTKIKNVVYNGTFPIDYPLKSRFEKIGSSCSSANEEEEEIGDGGEECEALKTMSMKELVKDRNVKFNLAKMRKEFQESLSEFEKFLAKGRPNRIASTFAIDEPL